MERYSWDAYSCWISSRGMPYQIQSKYFLLTFFQAIFLWKKMREYGIEPSNVTLTLALTACAKIGSTAFSVGQVSVYRLRGKIQKQD